MTTPRAQLKLDLKASLDALTYPIALKRDGSVHAQGTLTLVAAGRGGASDCRAKFNFLELR